MTVQEFIFNTPLYTKVELSENHILDNLCQWVHIDGYNPIKGIDSTFELRNPIDSSFISGEHVNTLGFVCQRYKDTMFVLVHFDTEENYIEKVGQYPSVADIHIAQVRQYKKVLGEKYLKDFTKAIGLAANGIGTGSFVYLRRIFEHLVSEIANDAINNGEVDKVQFETSKMDNKLKLLSSHLPEIVLENKPLYGVLSVGIHELSEEQCLNYFTVVREVIELILDEREYVRQKDEKKRLAHNKLTQIVGEIKK